MPPLKSGDDNSGTKSATAPKQALTGPTLTQGKSAGGTLKKVELGSEMGVMLQVRVNGVPQNQIKYTLEYRGERYSGQTKDNGWIRELLPKDPAPASATALPPKATSSSSSSKSATPSKDAALPSMIAKLSLHFPAPRGDEIYMLDLVQAGPVHSLEGTIARLRNLGFLEDLAPDFDPTGNEELAEAIGLGLIKANELSFPGRLLRDAITAFQVAVGLKPTGVADDTTRERLAQMHDNSR